MAGIGRNIGVSVKLILISFVLIISSIGISYAQETAVEEDTRKGVKHLLGVKAGQNISWIKLDPSVDQNFLRSPVIGISYSFMSQHFASIILEAQYIQYGWEEVFLDSTNTYSRELSYLEFPVLSNFIIGKKKTHLKFQAGFKIAMILDDVENSNVDDDNTQYYNGMEIEDRFELGLAFGMALSRELPAGELQLDARFNAGLSNLFTPADDITELLYSQNQGLTISLYYWFKIK